MWHLIEDKDIPALVKALTAKQKEVLFLTAVEHCSPQEIAWWQEKTDRAVRKLLTATLESIQKKLAPLIRERIEANCPEMTLAKRRFLARYEALDKGEGK